MGPAIGPGVASDVAVCAGDIGVLTKPAQLEGYFAKMKDSAEHVIWVLGNHEFYGGDYNETLDQANDLANKNDIILMDEALGTDNKVIDGVTFWGSTLWTDLKDGDYFVVNKIGHGMNDFHVITDGDKAFTAHTSMEINKRTRDKINYDADVVITHHHPLLRKHCRFPFSDITYGFCNDGLEQQIYDSKVKLWMFGHTHDSTSEILNGTHVISNQQGYPRKNWQEGTYTYEGDKFDPRLILEIK